MKEFISDCEQSLKEFTDNNYPQGSFFWNLLIKNKDIKVNGVKINKNIILKNGDKITYYLPLVKENKPAFYEVYRDKNIVIVDKESGVNSEAVYNSLVKEEECYFIHRLDRNTKGLMIFALNKDVESELLSLFKSKDIEKTYNAICYGHFKESSKILTAYLKKDEKNSQVFIYDEKVKGSEKIITEYSVLSADSEFSKVKIILHTGKTHQIRAHFAHIGHPILGDEKYGLNDINKKYHLTRQCLVAKELKISSSGILSYLKNEKFESRFNAEI